MEEGGKGSGMAAQVLYAGASFRGQDDVEAFASLPHTSVNLRGSVDYSGITMTGSWRAAEHVRGGVRGWGQHSQLLSLRHIRLSYSTSSQCPICVKLNDPTPVRGAMGNFFPTRPTLDYTCLEVGLGPVQLASQSKTY